MGFLFNKRLEILLIEKNRPERYKGRLNEVGGKIENGESPTAAIDKEFFEETGARATWGQFCLIHGIEHENFRWD